MKTSSCIESINAEQVAQFLSKSPMFFVDHETLLLEMCIPHQHHGSVSLVERQVSLLRERNHELRQHLNELMDIARDNDRLFAKTRALVLELLDVNTLEDVIFTVEDRLRNDFQAPYVSLILFSDTTLPMGRSTSVTEAKQALGSLLLNDQATSGIAGPHQLAFLFGATQSNCIASAAISPIIHQGLQGVLAVGSDDPKRYRGTIGTLFLNYIAEVLGRVLLRFPQSVRSVS